MDCVTECACRVSTALSEKSGNRQRPPLTPSISVQVLVDPRHQPADLHKLVVELLKHHVVRIQTCLGGCGLSAHPRDHPEQRHSDGDPAPDERSDHLASQHAQGDEGDGGPGSDSDAAGFPVRAASKYEDSNEHTGAGSDERRRVLSEPRGKGSLS